MKQFKVKHVALSEPGAFGVFLCDGIPFAVTLERTYAVGSDQTTKIPPGLYRCTRTTYIKGEYPTFEIHVPGHERILFHKANIEDELDGCIAVGEEFGKLNGKPAILHCGNGGGFDEFMQLTTGLDLFDLTME